MIYITGDVHGQSDDVLSFVFDESKHPKITENDTIVLLGDVGANYFGNYKDEYFKSALSIVPCKILCIHGNHEQRPCNFPNYTLVEWNGGVVWVEEKYPNLLFAKDGEIYNLEDNNCLVIGGAYSVDKHYRLTRNYGWWEDEQPSEEIKAYVESKISQPVDFVFSHTCPAKYTPTEMFIPGLDQSMVDNSTELWLDKIEDTLNYKTWFCGHWHTDKHIDKMHFLFKNWEVL